MAHAYQNQTTDPLLLQRPDACNPAMNAEYCSRPLPATAPPGHRSQNNGGLDHIEMDAIPCGGYNRGQDRHQQYGPVVVQVHGERRSNGDEKSTVNLHLNRKLLFTWFSSIVISVVTCCMLCCFVLPHFVPTDRPGCSPCGTPASRRTTSSSGTRSQRTAAAGDGDGKRTTRIAGCCSDPNGVSTSSSAADIERMIKEQFQNFREKHSDGLSVNGNILLLPSQIECAAHVVSHAAVSESTQPLVSDEDPTTIRSWDSRGDNSFMKPCITYDSTTGRFTVAQSGLYFIYSHLSFIGPVSGEPYAHRVIVQHSASPHHRSPLLHESRSVDVAWKPVDADAAVYTSNLQGLQSLRRLEALFVQAEPVDRLDQTGTTYFGLFKLRDTPSDLPKNASV